MIDPTAALPLHFTLETFALSAGGLLVAWAALRRRWAAAAAAAVLTVVQGLHAGQFIGAEDEPALVLLRLTALAALGVTIIPRERGGRLIGGGLGAMFAGTIWGALAGGAAEDLSVVGHVLMTAGAVAILAWVWQATRPSVRLRVLAAFISILAVTVVVAGGAVARVAAVDARNERYNGLLLESTTLVGHIERERDALLVRTAAVSSSLAIGTAEGTPRLARSSLSAGEWAVVLDDDRRELDGAAAEGVEMPYDPEIRASLPIVARALEGSTSAAERYQTDVASGALQLIASAPIYRPGTNNTAEDVIGALLIGRAERPSDLRELAADAAVDVAITDADATTATVATLGDAVRARGATRGAEFATVKDGGDAWLVSDVPVPGGASRLIVALPDHAVVGAATDLVRAFLVAILAAALLAVIAALWLSARITRPMLQLADDAERVKSDFLASVSHELRTPLTPIRGYTEILRSRSIPARDASGYLDEIGLAAQRLERIVALLVDVASIEAGRFRVLLDDVPVAKLLHETVERWRERSPRSIDVRAARSLPAVMADAAAVTRVLDELIDNALKFSPDSPGAKVELRARRVADGVELSVRDEGPGIDPDRLAAVRAAFHQEERGDSRRFGGLGLGLTFVEGVLEAHGSKLDIVSTEGGGTTCSFVLPGVGSVGRMPPKAQVRKR